MSAAPSAPRKILLIGKVGQVGYELRRTLATLGELTAVDYPEIDLTSPDSIRRWVTQVRPSVVVNAAAYTAVDKAESEEPLCLKINGTAPGLLAEAASKLGALLVHYSTDYVFDGAKTDPYTESDRPNPLNAYGRSKWAGDRAIAQVGGPHLILRTSWVYGARGQNFLLTIQRLARERPDLQVVDDQQGSPTWSRLIAEATAQILVQLQRRSDWDIRGLYNLAGGGQTTWFGFAKAIIQKLGIDSFDLGRLTPITSAQYPTAARRPRNSVLAKDRLRADFGLVPPPWEESLDRVCEELRA